MKRDSRAEAKDNMTRMLGAESYDELLRASGDELSEMAAAAKKRLHFKSKRRQWGHVVGNPYLMLGKKYNGEGKRVK